MQDVSIKQTISFILRMVRPVPWAIAVMFLVAIVWAVDLSLRPYLLKIILNRISENSTYSTFDYIAIPVGLYFFMTFLVTSIFRLYGYCIEIKMIPQLRRRIANSIFSYILGHSHNFYQNNFSGSLTNKINNLTDSIPDVIQISIDRFFSHSLAIIIATYTLWQVNIKFALAMLIWTVFFIFGALFFSKRIHKLSDDWSELGSTIVGRIVDVLSNILSVRLFARQKKEEAFLDSTFREAVHAEQKLQWMYFCVWIIYGYSFVVMQGICLYFLIKGREQGIISVGDFALVLGINIAVVDFLWQLTKDLSHFSKHLGKITQALRTTTLPLEIQDKPNASNLVVTKGDIVFDKVRFHYKGTEPLFKNKSVFIASGQKVGLVGYSGSGKTTFVSLILRLFEVTNGRILIDGQNIQDVTQNSLHQSIATIPQDPSLFHRTLMENIRYGRIDASNEEVIEAAKKAHAHKFITKLPQNYQSLVGERGVKLSGGQRQRIAVARAILKNAPILIMDEATSQLDSVTESFIQKSLWQLMQGKTTIVIAHRLSTLLHMDRILVFDQGKIVEDGSHKKLLAKGGLYKTLWDAQVGGFLPEKK